MKTRLFTPFTQAYNKQIKSLSNARCDANTQDHFAILPYALSSLI